MDLGLEGKKALVTGAGRGLGRSIAKTLARHGVTVVAVSRTELELESLLAEMEGKDLGHFYLAGDLMTDGHPTSIVKEVIDKTGGLDIVVHNVGGTLGKKDIFCTVEDWRQVWRLNFEVAAEINRIAIPAMQNNTWGRIVHISSIAAVKGGAAIPYSAVKAALNAYVRDLGLAVAPSGVIISAVMPGPILTVDGHWGMVMKNDPEFAKKFVTEKMAIKRFCMPEEISDFVTFLCSERASLFAGAVLPIDGGLI